MEIILSEKQKTLLEGAFKEQQTLQAQAQQEFAKIQKRIDDAVLLILDSKGLDIVPGIQYNEGKLTIPDEKVAGTEIVEEKEGETILKVVE